MGPSRRKASSSDPSDRPDDTEIAELVASAGVGLVRISASGRLETVSDEFASLTRRSRPELRGRPVDAVFPDEDIARMVAELLDSDGGEGVETAVLPLETEDGDAVPVEVRLRLAEQGGPEAGFVGVVRPVTSGRDVVRSESSSPWAASFVSLAEAIPDGIVVLDTDSQILYANPAVESILGRPPAELVGSSQLEIVPPRLREVHLASIKRCLETGERHVDWSYVELPALHADGYEVPVGISLNDFTAGGERYFVGLFRDVSARKGAESEAMRRIRQQDAIADLGRFALETVDLEALLDETADVLAAMLDADVTTVFERDPTSEELVLRATNGLPIELVGEARIPASGPNSFAGYALESETPVVVADLRNETRFDPPDRMLDRGVRSGISVAVGSPDDPWGMVSVLDTEPREYDETDVHAIESVTNVLASAVDRYSRTRGLERQRTQLDAVAQVYRVVQDVQEAVVDRSTREEIEHAVCGRLVELDALDFAWIGRVNMPDRTFEMSVSAGEGRGYLDEVTVAATEDAEGKGPAGEALRTGELQIVDDVAADESFAPWREAALERGFRSVAAIPIEYERTTYGVLVLYATETGAFGPEVRDIFASLGTVLGHGIMAITHRIALHADEVVEARLQVDGVGELFGVDPAAVDGLQFGRTIPIGGGQFVMYGTTSRPEEEITGLEDLDAIESVNVLSESGAEHRVEIRWTDPPICSLVAAMGGRINRGVVDGDTVTVTTELPPAVEIRELVEKLEAAAPGVSVTLQQRAVRDRSRSDRDGDGVLSRLTDRQRDAIEIAYRGGYFEWPRESNGDELAETMGIAGATFHQHLRAAERRMLDRVFGTDSSEGDR